MTISAFFDAQERNVMLKSTERYLARRAEIDDAHRRQLARIHREFAIGVPVCIGLSVLLVLAVRFFVHQI